MLSTRRFTLSRSKSQLQCFQPSVRLQVQIILVSGTIALITYSWAWETIVCSWKVKCFLLSIFFLVWLGAVCRFLQAGLSKSGLNVGIFWVHTCVVLWVNLKSWKGTQVCVRVYIHIQNRHIPTKERVKLYKCLLYKKLNCFPCAGKACCCTVPASWLGIRRSPLKTYSSDKLVKIYL